MHQKGACVREKVGNDAKLSCANYNESSNTGVCASVWNYSVIGGVYDKSITNEIYDNPVALAHEME